MGTLTMKLAQRTADKAQPPCWQLRRTVRLCTELSLMATSGFPGGRKLWFLRRAGRRGPVVPQTRLTIGGPPPSFTERVRTLCEERLRVPARESAPGVHKVSPGGFRLTDPVPLLPPLLSRGGRRDEARGPPPRG